MGSLFKLLAKKHQKISEKLNSLPSTPTSSSPTSDGAPDFVSLQCKKASINLIDTVTIVLHRPRTDLYLKRSCRWFWKS